MFFGEDTGVARYESQKHKVFESLTQKQLSFFWRPEEVDLSTDRMQVCKTS
ncbi:aerobic ribonucleotide reductase B subunit [Klebsiella phage CPRSB]|nr:aerobic ribonucleotide reductase B subunit [Klebsiella phage CPRSB]